MKDVSISLRVKKEEQLKAVLFYQYYICFRVSAVVVSLLTRFFSDAICME